MKRMFNYTKFNNENQDLLVESFASLARSYVAGKGNTAEYIEANKKFNEEFMKECVSAIPGAEFSSIEMLKNPMVYKSVFMLERFNTLLAQMITPVVPEVIAAGYNDLYDVFQVGYGDNARYTVESNEMFIVNSQAQGIARGGVQTTYNTEYTISASKHECSAYVDWYHVASSKQDWGRFATKIALAYSAYIEGKVVKAMESCITNASSHGISGYMANAFSDANWLTIARNVQLANGGADVYALGTKIALTNVLPNGASASSFKYNEKSDIVKTGYLPAYKGVPMIELGNALVPNTINGTPSVIASDKNIYFIPMGMNRPVKLVFEGQTVSVEKDPTQTADHTYTLAVSMMLGVDVVIGSKFGCITLP